MLRGMLLDSLCSVELIRFSVVRKYRMIHPFHHLIGKPLSR